MPSATFAQREHFAMMLSLPVVAAALLRATHIRSPWWVVILAGFSAGLLAVLKPPLAAVPVFVSLAAAMHARRWRVVLAPENLIAACFFSCYGASVYLFFPAFLYETLPMLRDAYFHVVDWKLTLSMSSLHWLGALALFVLVLHRKDLAQLPVSLLCAAAGGFLFSYFAQQKYFDYHALPAFVLGLSAISLTSLRRAAVTVTTPWSGLNAPSLGLAVLLAAGFFFAHPFQSYGGRLTRALQSMHPAPAVLGMSSLLDPIIGEVRKANGKWVGPFGAAIVPVHAKWMREVDKTKPAHDVRLGGWERWTAEKFRRSLDARKPDILIVAIEPMHDWMKWAERYPELRKSLLAYEFERRVEFSGGLSPLALYRRIEP